MGPMLGYACAGMSSCPLGEQLKALSSLVPAEAILVERAFVPARDRTIRRGLLDCVRPEDTVVLKQLACVADSMKEVMDFLQELESKGVNLVSIDEGIDTRINSGTNYEIILGALRFYIETRGAFHRDQTLEGLSQARQHGRFGGRPRKATTELVERARQLLESGESMSRVAKSLGIGRSTLYEAGLLAGAGGQGHPASGEARTTTHKTKKFGRP